MAYRVFTVNSGNVSEGARIDSLTLKGAGVEVPAVMVGEEGGGRRRGVVTIQGVKLTDRNKRLMYAEVGKTKADKPKFIAKNTADTDEKIIVVFRTPIGFRGGNSYTGDHAGWKCLCGAEGEGNVPEKCPNAVCPFDGAEITFAEFPGEILVTGKIAQGEAGRMGSGYQHVAVVPKNVVFRTGYSGRLYGSPRAHYYVWNGEQLLSATWEERADTDIF